MWIVSTTMVSYSALITSTLFNTKKLGELKSASSFIPVWCCPGNFQVLLIVIAESLAGPFSLVPFQDLLPHWPDRIMSTCRELPGISWLWWDHLPGPLSQ